eukprot:TRINITY_DN2011_c0_g3_i1.p1 TRINITY_DN2011_c0_g3~~TRINITY_DN2011_c0_g3_i1.p1  ORF type:complete len:331 (-),score=-8.66 TRINITY_DN2011_c0_g3_i1:57-1049(-)
MPPESQGRNGSQYNNNVAASQNFLDQQFLVGTSARHFQTEFSILPPTFRNSTENQWNGVSVDHHPFLCNQHGPVETDLDLRPRTKFSNNQKCSLPISDAGYFLLQEYLVDFNVAVPVFEPNAIIGLFQDCYNGRADGKLLSWIAMKVVLAIAHRLRAMSPIGVPQDAENTQIYLEEILGHLPAMMNERPSLLLCQCYCALAFLVSTSYESQSAAIFASTALRLAQDLQVEHRYNGHDITSEELAQRQRVLWIAYSLDADQSIKAGRQATSSVEILKTDLPVDDITSSVGEVRAVGGEFRINVFRLHAEMSVIQTDLMLQTHAPISSRTLR